jgi:hypothetical protein
MNRLSYIRPIPMHYGEQQTEAYRAEFVRRRNRIADKPISLQTYYSSSEFEESSQSAVIEYADEYDELPKIAADQWKAVRVVWFLAICIALVLAAYKFGWIAGDK